MNTSPSSNECKEPKACTILLRGPSKDILNEIDRNLADAMAVARNVVFNPSLAPGGGATEMAIAYGLSEFAKELEGVEVGPTRPSRVPWRSSRARSSRTAVETPSRTLTTLRAKHANGEHSYGVDGESCKVVEMKEYCLYESAAVKIQTLKTAIESASLLLRVDDVVSAKRVGRLVEVRRQACRLLMRVWARTPVLTCLKCSVRWQCKKLGFSKVILCVTAFLRWTVQRCVRGSFIQGRMRQSIIELFLLRNDCTKRKNAMVSITSSGQAKHSPTGHRGRRQTRLLLRRSFTVRLPRRRLLLPLVLTRISQLLSIPASPNAVPLIHHTILLGTLIPTQRGHPFVYDLLRVHHHVDLLRMEPRLCILIPLPSTPRVRRRLQT